MRRLELLDTSIVVELLAVPFESDRRDETLAGLSERVDAGIQLQLPVAAVLEAGNHVGRINHGGARRECAERFSDLVEQTLERQMPWTFTPVEWDEDLLRELIEPSGARPQPLRDSLASQDLEMGDLLVLAEFQRLRANLDRRVVDIDVWTYDENLRATADLIRSTG